MSDAYQQNKEKNGLKEFIFFTPAGYRHFMVLGKDLKDAEENFMRLDLMKRVGFSLEDLPVRLEFDEEKCKNWSWDKYLDNNEARKN